MPEFDLDAALTWTNPLADADIYMQEGYGRYRGISTVYEVYATYERFYHYIGSIDQLDRAALTDVSFECQSPFEVESVTMTLDEGIEHLIDAAGKFLSENPDRFWKGRKSHLVNAIYHARV